MLVNSLPVFYSFLKNPLDKTRHMNIIIYEQMLIYKSEKKEESRWEI